MDQLAGLRKVTKAVSRKTLLKNTSKDDMPFIWGIGGGKGGIGKTLVASACSIAIAAQGKKVLLVDAGNVLSGVNLYFENIPAVPVEKFLNGEVTLYEILVRVNANLQLLSFTQAEVPLNTLSYSFLDRLLGSPGLNFDFLIFDLGNGFSEFHEAFLGIASEISVLADSQYSSIANGYAFIKLIRRMQQEVPIGVIINRSESQEEAVEAFNKLDLAARHFLGEEIFFKGWIQECPELKQYAREMVPITQWPGQSALFASIRNIVQNRHYRAPLKALNWA